LRAGHTRPRPVGKKNATIADERSRALPPFVEPSISRYVPRSAEKLSFCCNTQKPAFTLRNPHPVEKNETGQLLMTAPYDALTDSLADH
jgi:hypothetical protein